MSTSKPKVVVVMPAYNAARTLHMTYAELPRDVVDLVIVVDDGSSDETAAVARQLGLELFVHNRNYGYGANQKTCYREALKAGADIIVMVHPDYQYDPTLLPEVIRPITEGRADVVLGSRLLGGQPLKGGMPWWKYVSNRFLTGLENKVFGLRPGRVPHRLPRLPQRDSGSCECCDGLGQLHLRPGNHGAVRPGERTRRGGSGADPLLPAGVVGIVRAKQHLRALDSSRCWRSSCCIAGACAGTGSLRACSNVTRPRRACPAEKA